MLGKKEEAPYATVNHVSAHMAYPKFSSSAHHSTSYCEAICTTVCTQTLETRSLHSVNQRAQTRLPENHIGQQKAGMAKQKRATSCG